MPSCIIPGCTNRTDPKRKRDVQINVENFRRISYHKFPQKPHKCQMWLAALKLHNWNPSKTATICSEHFTICRCAEKAIRTRFTNNNTLLKNVYETKLLENEIVQEFIGRNIFKQLNDHIKNQEPLKNHCINLIKLIVETYIKIRICHFLKEPNLRTTNRQFYNKLILFKGQ